MKTNIILLMLLSFSVEAMENAFEKLNRIDKLDYWREGYRLNNPGFDTLSAEELVDPENSPFRNCYKQSPSSSPKVTIKSIIKSSQGIKNKKAPEMVEFDFTPEQLLPSEIISN